METSSGQDNDTSNYNEEDSLDPRIQVMSDINDSFYWQKGI